MIQQNFYFQIILRVLLLCISCFAFAYFILEMRWLYSFMIGGLLLLQMYLLIQFINSTNRKIAYFFKAIKNEDFTVRFAEDTKTASFNELHKSINIINDVLQKVHLKNESQEQYYQSILKQVPIGILTLNTKGHILFSNTKATQLFNFSPLNHIKQLTQVDQDLYDLLHNLKAYDRKLFQFSNEREKTELVIQAMPISIEKAPLLLVIIQDIEPELDQKETETWERLLRVLTHEIMNTIAPITSISESILPFFKTDQGLQSTITEQHIQSTAKGLEVIQEQGNNLIDFVHAYRSLLQIPKPDKKIVLAQPLLDKLQLLLEQYNKNGECQISVTIEPDSLSFFIDEQLITQSLLNLGKNALQALENRPNSTLKIEAGITVQEKKFIRLTDNGPGISAELQKEIFVPFFTTKTNGTGIGLPLCKQIMRLHNGSLKLNSIPEEYTVFALEF